MTAMVKNIPCRTAVVGSSAANDMSENAVRAHDRPCEMSAELQSTSVNACQATVPAQGERRLAYHEIDRRGSLPP
jgi:hypothetical protein